MKTKYERLSKQEKKEVYKIFKVEKSSLAKKMRNMFLLIYAGIFYSILAFIYDFFYTQSMFSYILDIIVFIFCFVALLRVLYMKKDLLNDFVLKKDKEKKKEVLKNKKNKK